MVFIIEQYKLSGINAILKRVYQFNMVWIFLVIRKSMKYLTLVISHQLFCQKLTVFANIILGPESIPFEVIFVINKI